MMLTTPLQLRAPAQQRSTGPSLARQVKARGLNLDKPERLWEAGGTLALPYAQPPAYLDGSLPGDRGFDPLRLVTIRPGPVSEDKDSLAWMAESELYHGRIAMTAVAGIVVQEILGKGPWWQAPGKLDLAPGIPENRGVIPHIWQCRVGQGTCPPEAYSGSQPYPENGFQIAPGVDKYWAVVLVAHIVFAWLEYNRYRNFRSGKTTGVLNIAPFDPLGLNNDRNRQAEVRNGRLALLAVAGFAAQAIATGTEPLEGLQRHLANPTGYNILSNAPGTFWALLVGSIGVGALEASRSRSAQEAGQEVKATAESAANAAKDAVDK